MTKSTSKKTVTEARKIKLGPKDTVVGQFSGARGAKLIARQTKKGVYDVFVYNEHDSTGQIVARFQTKKGVANLPNQDWFAQTVRRAGGLQMDAAALDSLKEDQASDYGVSDADRNPSMSKMGRSRPTRKTTDADIERRDREAGMAMDAMTAAKRKKERAMFGEATATEKDMDHSKAVVVKGVKGMKSKPFTKKFRNMAAYDKWSDSDAAGDYEVHQIMNEAVESQLTEEKYIIRAKSPTARNYYYISQGSYGPKHEAEKFSADEAKKVAKKMQGGSDEWVTSIVKIKESQLNEGVLDDMDDDGFMAKRQLYDLAKYSVELHRLIQDTDNLEPWVQAKITKAADYIDTVKHYLEYQGVRDADDMADEVGIDDIADVDASLDAMAPVEEVMEFEDEEATEVTGDDVLHWAKLRGVISGSQYVDPEPVLQDLADNLAYDIGTLDEVGSSDVSIWMRQLVDMAEADNVLLMGPKVDAYYKLSEAQKRFNKMIAPLKGKK